MTDLLQEIEKDPNFAPTLHKKSATQESIDRLNVLIEALIMILEAKNVFTEKDLQHTCQHLLEISTQMILPQNDEQYQKEVEHLRDLFAAENLK